jgi:ABC-type antimicrobial peptide transport system, ATPase component
LSVKLVEVYKTYTFSENNVYALRGINLHLEKGETAALTGPPGSGKTTLLNLIGALDKPSKGKIYVDDVDLTALKKLEQATLRQRRIGFILQAYNLIPVLTVYENVELPMLAAGVPPKEREARAKELLKTAELTERMHHRPTELSRGEEQRVAILCALANRPAIVLADEPTGDLDPEAAKEVVQTLCDFSNREGTTVIMATRDSSVAAMASHVFEMNEGMILKEHINAAATSALNATVIVDSQTEINAYAQ